MKRIILVILFFIFLIMPLQAKSKIDEHLLVDIGTKITGGNIVYNGNSYMYLIPEKSIVYLSKDGKTWHKEEALYHEGPMEYFVTTLKEVIWDKKQFVAITDLGIMTSLDGINWVGKTLKDKDGKQLKYFLEDIAYINGVYSIVGSPKDDSLKIGESLQFTTAGFLYSLDLETFFTAEAKNVGQSIIGARPVENILQGNGKLLGFGTDETIMVSGDGKSWSGQKGTFVGGEGVWDGKQYITAHGDTIWTSSNGVNWKEVYKVKNSSAPFLNGVYYNGHAYVATGENEGNNSKQDWIYFFSKDGITWEERILAEGNVSVVDVQATKDGFIIGGNKIYYLQTSGSIVGNSGSNTYIKPVFKKPTGYGKLSTQTKESIREIAVGDNDHYMALSHNNNLYEWGRDLSETYKAIGLPRMILSNVKKAIPASYHAGAITMNNELYLWGSNSNQEVCESGQVNIHYPIKVMDNVVDAALDYKVTYVVKENGDLYGKGRVVADNAIWGKRLGIATERYYDTYTKMASNVRSVITDGTTSAYITNNNELYMWGHNDDGQLGIGSLTDQMEPVQVMTQVKDVKMDFGKTLVLTQKGELYAFGDVGEMLGLSYKKVKKPYKMLTGIKQIDVYQDQVMALKNNNELLKWNSNSKPKVIYKNVQQAGQSMMHRVILTMQGEVLVDSGDNSLGSLGDGTTNDNYNWDVDYVKVKGFIKRQVPSETYIKKNSISTLFRNGNKVASNVVFAYNGKSYISLRALIDAGMITVQNNSFDEYIIVDKKTNRKAIFHRQALMEVGGRSYIPVRDLAAQLKLSIANVAGGVNIV